MAELVSKNGLLAQLLVRSAENLVNSEQFLTFCTLPGTTSAKTIPSLADTFGVQNSTLSGTFLENGSKVVIHVYNKQLGVRQRHCCTLVCDRTLV